jgi:DNA-directed RNA polymerase subunit RPC12/RpoP
VGENMLKIYTCYKCKRCKRETILLTEEVETTKKEGKYLCCSHCGCKRLIKEKETDDFRECMKARSYIRTKGGAIREKE